MSLQFYDESGRREVVGMLERTELTDGQPVLHVRKKDDTVVAVPLNKITAGRVVPPPRQRSG